MSKNNLVSFYSEDFDSNNHFPDFDSAETEEEKDSLEEYMKALNTPGLTKEEVKQFRSFFRNMAAILVEHFLETKKGKTQIINNHTRRS